MYDTHTFIIQLINNLGILDGNFLVPLNILYPLDKSHEQSYSEFMIVSWSLLVGGDVGESSFTSDMFPYSCLFYHVT